MTAFFACAAVLLGGVWPETMPHLGVSPRNAIDNICPARAMRRAAEEARGSLAASRLPAAWLDRIGTNRVMIAGWAMGPAMSGDLNLVPLPALQTYSAYTPYLDGRCAERVAQEVDSVRFVLVPANPWTVDTRNIYFDNPRLWREVRRHFRLVDHGHEHVLLERRQEPLQFEESNGAFALKRPFLDKLRALLFRPTRAMAHFTFADGRASACFANLEVLDGTPVPLTLPTTPEEVPAYFGDAPQALSQVKAVKVVFGVDEIFVHDR